MHNYLCWEKTHILSPPFPILILSLMLFLFFSYPFFILSHSTAIQDNALVLLFSKCWTGMRESINLLLFWPKNRKVVAWLFSLPRGKPKGKAFWLGLAVICLGWQENDFWVLFKTILLRFGFSYAWFFLHWFLGSFPNYSSAFLFSVCLVWPKNPKSLAWLFSLPRGKPKGRSFLAWFDSSLLGLAAKWFMGSFLSYPFAFSFFIWLFWPKNLKVVAWFARCFLSWFFGLAVIWRSKKLYFFVFLRLIWPWLTIILPLQHKSFNFFAYSVFLLCYDDFSQDKRLNFFVFPSLLRRKVVTESNKEDNK